MGMIRRGLVTSSLCHNWDYDLRRDLDMPSARASLLHDEHRLACAIVNHMSRARHAVTHRAALYCSLGVHASRRGVLCHNTHGC